MTTYDELLELSHNKFEQEIFPLLLNNQLIKKNTGFIHHSFPKRLDRLELQKKSIEYKINFLHKHIDNGNNLHDFDKSILADLIFILSQTMLGYFEIFKSYLENFLDLSRILISDDTPTFNEIVKKLSEFKNSDGGLVFHYDGLRKFFNMDMRNTLIHDSWWLDENFEFTFEELDGTVISFNIGELHGELAGINAIVFSFAENYVKNFDSLNYENIRHTYPQLFR